MATVACISVHTEKYRAYECVVFQYLYNKGKPLREVCTKSIWKSTYQCPVHWFSPPFLLGTSCTHPEQGQMPWYRTLHPSVTCLHTTEQSFH